MNALNQVSSQLVLVPAYSRVYKSSYEMLLDWKAGKDFKVFRGTYCSIRDIEYLRKDASQVVLTQDHFEYTVV